MTRDVGLRLVIVVVGDKILHRVVREELLELRVELGSQGLVVRHHKRGSLQLLDDVCHGEGLARAGCTQEHLVSHAAIHPFDQLANGFRLVSSRLVRSMQFEFHTHFLLSVNPLMR